MGLSKDGRFQRVELFATDFESLKDELAEQLGRAQMRQGKTTLVQYCKTPMGFECEVEPLDTVEVKFIIPIKGTLADFGVELLKGAKNCELWISQVCADTTTSVKRDIKEGHQSLDLKLSINAFSVITFSVANLGNAATKAIVGFTFSEGGSHALLETQPD